MIQQALNQLKPEEIPQFLAAFFTSAERHQLQERLEIFRRLAAGQPQRQVATEVGCGIATVTRGAKAYREHQLFIDRLLAQLSPRTPR